MGQIIGLIWPHPRPFMISVGHTLIPHTADPSFPSDHATVFSVVSLCLLLAGEIVPGVAMLLIGLCVAWARLYLGVHFPLDMVGAMAVALVGYLLVMPAWSRLGRSITDGAETLYRSMFRMAISRGWTLP